MRDGWLSVQEVADACGLTYQTIYRLIRRGELPAEKEEGPAVPAAAERRRGPTALLAGPAHQSGRRVTVGTLPPDACGSGKRRAGMTGTEVGAASGGPTRAPSPMELRVASALMIATLAAGLVGFIIGAAELPDEFAAAEAVAIWSVGVVGLLSWLRHYVFYRGDAARMGWTGGFAGFQWEVGYANLAFGLTALAAVFGDWGEGAVAAAVVGYGLYMLQAGLVHVWQAFTITAREHLGAETVVRKSFSLIFAGVLLYYGARALEAADAWPF